MATSKIQRSYPYVKRLYQARSGVATTADLDEGLYVLIITRLNGSNSNYAGGLYILSARNDGSYLLKIVEPVVATVSFSYPTLTVVPSSNYVMTSIIRINNEG